jgi:hypothetical protein
MFRLKTVTSGCEMSRSRLGAELRLFFNAIYHASRPSAAKPQGGRLD